MGPASLYTYFESLDALFTELILRSYDALATALEAAATWADRRPPGDRVLVLALAYRRWALEHRSEFNLVWTDQLPGFAAEPGGPTVDAETRVFRVLATAMAAALGRPAPPQVEVPVDGSVDLDGDVGTFFGVWGVLHGLVSLEVNHHLDWLDAARLMESRLRWALAAAGLPAAAPDTCARFDRWASRRRDLQRAGLQRV
jgi:AcrR family transcriptional regulator